MAEALIDAPPVPNLRQTAQRQPLSPADIAATADAYALAHRKRSALIRALGRLPDKLKFGPLSPELVNEIVTGSS